MVRKAKTQVEKSEQKQTFLSLTETCYTDFFFLFLKGLFLLPFFKLFERKVSKYVGKNK